MTVYIARQHLKYAAPLLFDLVADVERYPEFMPWVVASRIRRRKDQTLFVDMTIGLGPLRKRFLTVGVLDRPQRIHISSSDPIFDRFEQSWTFAPMANAGTDIGYYVDVQLRSRMLQRLMRALFADIAAATMAAYKGRAQKLYDGQP
jgi:coenzyme Q-binding protein COQ10